MPQGRKLRLNATLGTYFQMHTVCTFLLIKIFKRLYSHPSLIFLAPAKAEAGIAQRQNVLELALFMGVATTVHMIKSHMAFEETVLTLLSR